MRIFFQQQSKSKKVIICIILLCTIIVTIIWLFLILSGRNNQETDNTVKVGKVSDNKSWFTYNNTDYSFFIKYPDNWKLEETPRYNELNPETFGGIVIYKEETPQGRRYQLNLFTEDNPEELSARDWVDNLLEENKQLYNINQASYEISYEELKEVKVGNKMCYGMFDVFAIDEIDNNIYCSHNDKIYVFMYPVNEENENLFAPLVNYQVVQQILTTFKFID